MQQKSTCLNSYYTFLKLLLTYPDFLTGNPTVCVCGFNRCQPAFRIRFLRKCYRLCQRRFGGLDNDQTGCVVMLQRHEQNDGYNEDGNYEQCDFSHRQVLLVSRVNSTHLHDTCRTGVL